MTKTEIVVAMTLLEFPSVKLNNPKVEQLKQSLQVYQDRGEFDGSLDSAIECLTRACYELEDETDLHS